jgi:transposase
MSPYAKRLQRSRFIWPSPADGVVAITVAQLAYMLEGIDWRNPLHRIVKLTATSEKGMKRSKWSRCRDRVAPLVGCFGSEDPQRGG